MTIRIPRSARISIRVITAKHTGQKFACVGMIRKGYRWQHITTDKGVPLTYKKKDMATARRCAEYIRKQQHA